MSGWDVHGVGLSWLLAGLGIGLTVVAAAACNSSATAATVCLLVAVLSTVQLLGFAFTCLSYRSWLVTSIHAPRIGPGQQEPRSRRGLPALRSSQGVAGLDLWSVLVISLLTVPILVPLLAYHKPSEHFGWSTAQQASLGATASDDFNDNGATWYTVGAYESITMSLQADVPGRGNITMANTADIAVDAEGKRVFLPSRVSAACKHEEVEAKGLKALVGMYSCNSTIAAATKACNDSFTGTAEKDYVCLTLQNATAGHPVPQQFMRVQHQDMAVSCSLTYGIATVDVTWRGITKGRARLCHIAEIKPISNNISQDDPALKHPDVTNTPRLLTLPLVNAFMHTVSHERITTSSQDAIELFYGSIFAAATTIRSVSNQFDPTRSTVPITVRYSSSTCQRYGWSGLPVFLLIANIMLAICCTTLCSGVTMNRLTDLAQDTLGPLACFCCHPPATKSTARHDATAGDAAQQQQSWKHPQPGFSVIGPGQQPVDGSQGHQHAAHVATVYGS